jgi:hypothetical protein
MRLSKIFMVAAATTLFAGSALAAGDGIDFKVDERKLIDGTSREFIADAFNFHMGGHVIQSVDGDGLNKSEGDRFTETGSFDISAFWLDNTVVPSMLNSVPVSLGGSPYAYGLSGEFTAGGVSGLFTDYNGSTGLSVDFDSFELDLWLDINLDGTKDILLGTATLLRGEANLTPDGIAKGDFHVVLEFVATTQGEEFFIDPKPFVLELDLAGVLAFLSSDDFLNSAGFDKTGSGDAWGHMGSNVPEPASLALFGLGLFGLVGFSRRRRNAVAE